MNDSDRMPTFRKDESRPARILNDVLGPVMTGPSSSHTAGPARLRRMIFDLRGGVSQADIYYSKSGSYAATLTGQASDRGFTASLLGWDCADPRLSRALKCADLSGVRIRFHVVDETYDHPNRAVIIGCGLDEKSVKVDTLTIKVRSMRITAINDCPILLDGSRDEFVWLDGEARIVMEPSCANTRRVRAIIPAIRDPQRRAPFVIFDRDRADRFH